MPSDLIVMLTVATNLEHNGDSLGAAVPFILLTTLIAALPLLGYLIFVLAYESGLVRAGSG